MRGILCRHMRNICLYYKFSIILADLKKLALLASHGQGIRGAYPLANKIRLPRSDEFGWK